MCPLQCYFVCGTAPKTERIFSKKTAASNKPIPEKQQKEEIIFIHTCCLMLIERVEDCWVLINYHTHLFH